MITCRHREQKPVEEARELEAYFRTIEPAGRPFAASDADSAIYIYDSIVHSLKDPPVIFSFMRYDFMYSLNTLVRKDNAKAALYLDSAIGYLERHRLTTQYPTVYFNSLCRKAELALFQENYNQAYEYYLKAKQWAFANLTSCEVADYSYSLAMVLYRQQKYPESSSYFKESFEQYSSCRRPVAAVAYRRQEIAGNIGLCYVKTKQYDSALAYFNRALTVLEQHRDSLGFQQDMARAVVWGNMAKVYVAQNKLDTAADLFKKSIAVNVGKRYDNMDAQLAQAQLAEVYARQYRYADMFTVLQQLRTGLDTLANPAATLSWRKLMSEYYRHAGRLPEEHHYYKEYITMRDSIRDAESAALQTNVTQQIRDKEKELEIALLKKNNQLNRTYLLITISLAVIAVLIIAVFYYIFRKTSRLNRQISAQKEELEHQKEELEQLNHVKNRLFSVISHDMRAPVNALSAFVTVLEETDQSKESLIRFSNQLKKKLAYTSGMMENMLNWAASQLQGFRPFLQWAGIRDIAEKAIGNTAGLAEEKGIKLANEIPPELAATIDRDMLQVVLRNLLSNAIKYSHPGGDVRISGREAGPGQVIIQVRDKGAGMPEDYVEKINSSDLEVLRSISGTLKEKGTGLGIYLCRTFAAMMNGSLQVESGPGTGTVVSVTLPA
ncbi:MAG: tetratricopeptide repeat-containing sensor histidine kinase [Chitinophagaceae bacterium]